MNRMVHHLEHQAAEGVEIRTAMNDDYLQRGKTRNDLLDAARGEYCCFVDDDDVVSDDYTAKILTALTSAPDICGITGQVIQMRNPVITRLFNCQPGTINPSPCRSSPSTGTIRRFTAMRPTCARSARRSPGISASPRT